MAAEVAAIVLAAGRATRFGAGNDDSKVAALLDGRALVAHVAAAALASCCSAVVVVTGQGERRCAEALAAFPAVRLVHNPDFASGMASSLRVGLAALPGRTDAAIVLLADMPRVRTATVDALVAAFLSERPDAVVPLFGTQRGNPVLVARALFPALERGVGDEGARRILAAGHHRVRHLPVDDPGVIADVDTRDALAAMQHGSA